MELEKDLGVNMDLVKGFIVLIKIIIIIIIIIIINRYS